MFHPVPAGPIVSLTAIIDEIELSVSFSTLKKPGLEAQLNCTIGSSSSVATNISRPSNFKAL